VDQIEVPASTRELTEVEPIDYEDAFLVDPAPAAWRPAEAAAQAVLGDAPAKLREALLAGWSSLGLRLGADGGRQVLGWRLRRADPEVEPVHPPMVRRPVERAASHTRFGP
jgi:hypothetical protein